MRWCFTDQTALAEAELEYEERTDPAIYVAFPVRGSAKRSSRRLGEPVLAGRYDDGRVFASIWTTTPWTIPSNLAIAVHPDESYVLVRRRSADSCSSSPRRCSNRRRRGWESSDRRRRGAPEPALVGLRYRHPLAARDARAS